MLRKQDLVKHAFAIQGLQIFQLIRAVLRTSLLQCPFPLYAPDNDHCRSADDLPGFTPVQLTVCHPPTMLPTFSPHAFAYTICASSHRDNTPSTFCTAQGTQHG